MLAFRELSKDELNFVSGGDIVVTAPRPSTYSWGSGSMWGGGSYWDSGQSNEQQDSGGDSWDPNGDDDGDGILNQNEEIVVTAEFTALELQAISQQAAWMQWELNMGLNAFLAERLLLSGLSGGTQAGIGLAYGGASSLPPVDDAQYNLIWEYVYATAVSAKHGYIPEHGFEYYP